MKNNKFKRIFLIVLTLCMAFCMVFACIPTASADTVVAYRYDTTVVVLPLAFTGKNYTSPTSMYFPTAKVLDFVSVSYTISLDNNYQIVLSPTSLFCVRQPYETIETEQFYPLSFYGNSFSDSNNHLNSVTSYTVNMLDWSFNSTSQLWQSVIMWFGASFDYNYNFPFYLETNIVTPQGAENYWNLSFDRVEYNTRFRTVTYEENNSGGGIIDPESIDNEVQYNLNQKAVVTGEVYECTVTYYNSDNTFLRFVYLSQNLNTAYNSSGLTYSLSDFFPYRIYYDMNGFDNSYIYNYGYQEGETAGREAGYNSGYNSGFSVGKSVGFSEGVANANEYTFLGLFSAVFDAPISALSGLLNFDILGVNILSFTLALFTLCIVFFIIKRLIL